MYFQAFGAQTPHSRLLFKLFTTLFDILFKLSSELVVDCLSPVCFIKPSFKNTTFAFSINKVSCFSRPRWIIHCLQCCRSATNEPFPFYVFGFLTLVFHHLFLVAVLRQLTFLPKSSYPYQMEPLLITHFNVKCSTTDTDSPVATGTAFLQHTGHKTYRSMCLQHLCVA